MRASLSHCVPWERAAWQTVIEEFATEFLEITGGELEVRETKAGKKMVVFGLVGIG
jgi:hypothetical protein